MNVLPYATNSFNIAVVDQEVLLMAQPIPARRNPIDSLPKSRTTDVVEALP